MIEEQILEQSINSLPTKSEDGPNEGINNCQRQKATIFLVVFGFYFLIMTATEFLTNSHQNRYKYDFTCVGKQCRSQTEFITFSESQTIYLYLKNSHTSQHDISFQHLPNTHISSYQTNTQMNKKTSLMGKNLPENASAFPQGQFLSYYPESTFTLTKQTSSSQITISTQSLSIWGPTNKNLGDKNKQWADVEMERFAVWQEKQISPVLKKYWGKISTTLSGSYEIDLIANNLIQEKFKNNLSIELTDGNAFGGNNLSLLIVSAVFAVIVFFLSFVSFLFNFSYDSPDPEDSQSFNNDSIPINIYKPALMVTENS